MKFGQKHADRLLTLAYFLKTQVKPGEFSMISWIGGAAGKVGYNQLREEHVHNCGTTACAVGYCPIVFPDDWESTGFLPIRSAGKNRYGIGSILTQAQEFFCLNRIDGTHLFMSGMTRTPKQEAAIIEKFVEKKGFVYA
jgi:hypothetical protein